MENDFFKTKVNFNYYAEYEFNLNVFPIAIDQIIVNSIQH